jgi:hypothetical protein
MAGDDQELWRLPSETRPIVCVMISCCGGAELQVRDGEQILLRELYPTKPDLYERARGLETDYRARSEQGTLGRRSLVADDPAVAQVDDSGAVRRIDF